MNGRSGERRAKDDVAIIDADAHVEADVETWDYLDEEFRDRRPIPVLPAENLQVRGGGEGRPQHLGGTFLDGT